MRHYSIFFEFVLKFDDTEKDIYPEKNMEFQNNWHLH